MLFVFQFLRPKTSTVLLIVIGKPRKTGVTEQCRPYVPALTKLDVKDNSSLVQLLSHIHDLIIAILGTRWTHLVFIIIKIWEYNTVAKRKWGKTQEQIKQVVNWLTRQNEGVLSSSISLQTSLLTTTVLARSDEFVSNWGAHFLAEPV